MIDGLRNAVGFCAVGWVVFAVSIVCRAADNVSNDVSRHQLTLSDAKRDLILRVNCDHACTIDSVLVRGREVVATETGVCTGIKVDGQWVTTRANLETPTVETSGRDVVIKDIRYTAGSIGVRERWTFTAANDRIDWVIDREYLNAGTIEDTCFPGWDFRAMQTWTGALLDTGGVAWGQLLPAMTSYGAHSRSATFFTARGDVCLDVAAKPSSTNSIASRFSHQPSGVFSFVQSVTPTELATASCLHRFNRSLDIWAPFAVQAGATKVDMTLRVIDNDQARGRGNFVGIDGASISNLLDTIGRYGVIDQRIAGGNGWITGYVCLHEPFFAAMGLAIDDPDYTTNLVATLDEWRDHAQTPDGRVMSRWHHDTTDNMVPGTYNATTGFYECGWGYLLDAQPDYVINVSEQFDLTGDLPWLRSHKDSCERALDWLLKRDIDGNGLVEMMTDNHASGKSSDWIDVVWASGENALVNAAMYEALNQWSDREKLLGDPKRAELYHHAADKLHDAFCRPISQGGFWNDEQGWFAYWRDRDGTIHGDNLVTPVNFSAVAYGLADEPQKRRILEGIEQRMRKENLFHWPLCFLPYAAGETGNANFPDYENGDIFLSWGELAVRSYSTHDPAVAIDYICRILDQYKKDGLSFQRYLRRDGVGAGEDILAGNCMTIVGLYRDIYGIRPQWNRLKIDPHLTPELDNAAIRYRLRGQQFIVKPGMTNSSVTVDESTVRAPNGFAIDAHDHQLRCYVGSGENPALTVRSSAADPLAIDIASWPAAGDGARWTVSRFNPSAAIEMTVGGLKPSTNYRLQIDSGESTIQTDATGTATIRTGAAASNTHFQLTDPPNQPR